MLPILLVPGLNCSAMLFANQIPHLWRFGSVTIANHTCGETVGTIAHQILASAPPRFTLVGFSMGGYIAFEILRQARERVVRLALIDTGAQADTAQQSERRRQRIAMAQSGRFSESLDLQFPLVVHPNRHGDGTLRETYRSMAMECGADAFVRHLNVDMSRPDSRPDLAGILCPTTVVVGENDQLTPPALAREMANGISGARLVIVPESGHLSPLEQPTAVTQALIDLLRTPMAPGDN
jgi:pimeloyl-ACP methyl ester carboxylesterase